MSDRTWTFRDREIKNYGDVSSVMSELYDAQDRNGARDFMAVYRAFSEHADANVGYITGYYGDMGAMQEFFDVSHPIFGRTTPTPDEALAAGIKAASA